MTTSTYRSHRGTSARSRRPMPPPPRSSWWPVPPPHGRRPYIPTTAAAFICTTPSHVERPRPLPPTGRCTDQWSPRTPTPLHGVAGAGRVPSTIGGRAPTGLHKSTHHEGKEEGGEEEDDDLIFGENLLPYLYVSSTIYGKFNANTLRELLVTYISDSIPY
jgi:hypothetical protein